MSAAPSARRPGRPRAEDAPVAVEAMLAAALRAFATHGYDGVSVNALSRQLGVSHNLLHQPIFNQRCAILGLTLQLCGVRHIQTHLVLTSLLIPKMVQRHIGRDAVEPRGKFRRRLIGPA